MSEKVKCFCCQKPIRWYHRRHTYPNGQSIHIYPCLFIFIRTRAIEDIWRLYCGKRPADV
jgi:hypothetical protein